MMYAERGRKTVWNLTELSDPLKESELFTYQVLRELKAKGYVYSIVGSRGGYSLFPGSEMRSLRTFMSDFNRTYVANPMFNTSAASEYTNRFLVGVLDSIHLIKLFEAGRPKPFLSVPEPDGAA